MMPTGGNDEHLDSDVRPRPARYRRWLRIILALGILWGQLFLVLALVRDPSKRNLTLMLAIQCSGLYTVMLYLTRAHWLPWAKQNPIRNATILGIANAGIVETLFLVLEKILGASGVAANPNLIMDLILTWPWYMGMVWIFVRVQARQQFCPEIVLLLAGLYECGSDGFIGGVVGPLIAGAMPNLLIHALQVLGFAVWQFIPVYSSMILPAVWIVDEVQPTSPPPPAWRDALKPLLWLIPFILYLGAVIIVIGIVKNLSGGQ